MIAVPQLSAEYLPENEAKAVQGFLFRCAMHEQSISQHMLVLKSATVVKQMTPKERKPLSQSFSCCCRSLGHPRAFNFSDKAAATAVACVHVVAESANVLQANSCTCLQSAIRAPRASSPPQTIASTYRRVHRATHAIALPARITHGIAKSKIQSSPERALDRFVRHYRSSVFAYSKYTTQNYYMK